MAKLPGRLKRNDKVILGILVPVGLFIIWRLIYVNLYERDTLGIFLRRCELGEYAKVMRERGYKDVEDILGATESNLVEDLPKALAPHRRRMLRCAQRVLERRAETRAYQERLFTLLSNVGIAMGSFAFHFLTVLWVLLKESITLALTVMKLALLTTFMSGILLLLASQFAYSIFFFDQASRARAASFAVAFAANTWCKILQLHRHGMLHERMTAMQEWGATVGPKLWAHLEVYLSYYPRLCLFLGLDRKRLSHCHFQLGQFFGKAMAWVEARVRVPETSPVGKATVQPVLTKEEDGYMSSTRYMESEAVCESYPGTGADAPRYLRNISDMHTSFATWDSERQTGDSTPRRSRTKKRAPWAKLGF